MPIGLNIAFSGSSGSELYIKNHHAKAVPMTTPPRDEFLDSLHPNPFAQFGLWHDEAVTANLPQPNAMTLATSTRDGKPSARIVLMKWIDHLGLTFVTNYQSRKGREIDENPFVALTFHWAGLERQVRIEGTISRLTPEDSDRLFAARPRDHQLSSLSSKQSEPTSLADLNARYTELDKQFHGREIPRPVHWGGCLVSPNSFEFWQHRFARMNDRVLYARKVLAGSVTWERVRLAP